MTYSGSRGLRGWLRTVFAVRPTFNRLVTEHLDQGQQMAEKRAKRSRVHRRSSQS